MGNFSLLDLQIFLHIILILYTRIFCICSLLLKCYIRQKIDYSKNISILYNIRWIFVYKINVIKNVYKNYVNVIYEDYDYK